ncbi:MFS transporter [Streptomyces mobaraensis NBRC 13819 = DSM 40847]|uniref:Major facilitator superfamily multidrug resistance protein n=1 Tax=Streptomyces mobaraensis (strain ATCC 29032 / DSM 40847 / JCM 4168 / NBRC 13819 / NCIMB 11159 / IPCR 16-22) TaxID=1223523 RepID=M3ATS1_STRM1|nr:MFS transporter [Streptomyces mobaraensis]EME96982.1 major facilitator superfamily multidrug resistance protein [Streptomyces mobaraensis NBRC 13819 = DSM 40847]QTT74245.1 MFS transporter [Streptomyces mobaraensis NBRC 13819 = DSM 40847]
MTKHALTNRAAPAAVSGPSAGIGGRAWLRAGVAVAAVGWGANQFAPLLLLYRSELGLSAATVQATFGLYAIGLVPGLLLGGPVSDRYGRRRLMLPALFVSVLASLLLIAGGSQEELLFAGRLVSGVASGAAFSSGTVWIKELSLAGSTREANPGPRRATITMTTGFAVGPLVAGLLAQWAPSPMTVAYLPHLALALVSIPLVWGAPETCGGSREGSVWRQVRVPAVREPRFRNVVAPLAPWVFGSASVALAYLPGLVKDRVGGNALVFGAVVTALTGFAGILVQPLARRMDDPRRPRLIASSMAIVVAGLLVSAAAAETLQPALVVLAALVLGAGYGCCQVCGLLEVQRMAGPKDLAGLTAVYQALSYIGFAAPFVLAALQDSVRASVLLCCAAGLAVLTLVYVTLRAARGGGRGVATAAAGVGATAAGEAPVGTEAVASVPVTSAPVAPESPTAPATSAASSAASSTPAGPTPVAPQPEDSPA